MSSSRKRHSDEDWLQHRATIHRMFLQESASFSEVMRKLEEDGFPVTKSQLEYKLRVWGLRRRIPKNKTEILWQFIDDGLTKREKQGKLSEVIHEGNVIVSARVRKERSRYQRTSLENYLQVFRARGSYTTTVSASRLSMFPADLAVLKIFSLSESRAKSNVALLTAKLASMMPERKESESISMAQAMLKAPNRCTMPEHYKFIIYRISNNMEGFGNGTSKSLSRWLWIVNVLENSGIRSSKLPIGENSGPTVNAFAEKLLQNAMLMMGEIKDQDRWGYQEEESDSDLEGFETEVENTDRWGLELTRTKNVVLCLLSSGQDPNIWGLRERNNLSPNFTPLQLALLNRDANFALQLLDAGADPRFSYTGSNQVLEEMQTSSFDHEHKLVFKRFADSGLSLDEGPDVGGVSALMRAVDNGNLSMAEILVQSGANVLWSIEYRVLNGTFRKINVLGCAAAIGREERAMELLRLLTDHAHSTYPSKPLAEFFESDVVMNASSKGHVSVLNFLHEIEYDIAGVESGGLTALHMAAYLGRHRACKALLDYGSFVDGPHPSTKYPTPIILAALEGHEDVVELLHQAGADLSTSFVFEANDCSSMKWRWETYPLSQRLAELTRHLGDCSINPAGAAIFGHYCMSYKSHWGNPIYKYLAKHGARLPDWAAYHGACTGQLSLVKIALGENAKVNVNWLGRDKKTLLQILLSSGLEEIESDIQRPSVADYIVGLCLEILGAGAVLVGDEAPGAVLLGNWSLVETILHHDLGKNLQGNNGMSLLEAVFLLGLGCMIQYAFERNPEAYDGSALCAAVLFASEHKSLKHLERLFRTRQNLESPPLLEGTAIGLAVWSADTEVLRTIKPYCDLQSYFGLAMIGAARAGWRCRYPQPPFWHRKDLQLIDPLLFILQSPRSNQKLQKLGFRAEEHSIYIAFNIDSEEVLEIQLGPNRKQVNDDLLILASSGGDLVDEEEKPTVSYMEIFRGRSLLQKAVEDGNLERIEGLVMESTKVNEPAATNSGATALQLAAITGRIGIAKMLIEFGANVDAPRALKNERTALEGAAEHGRIDMIQLLLSMGAGTGGRGRLQYMRAIKFAEREGHKVAPNMLREYRDWTVDDHNLWRELEVVAKDWDLFLEDFFFDDEARIKVEDGKDTLGGVIR
ncbi:hypothetical protein CSAL01_00638 [Colletotrichum salicis]|uniref:Clr5 domain-containing protein n=1 Tax=Colletotrichum salicis TaxID=1209931 RepID=A0A135V5R3_9PEZI|nr:hypothetical protein CSAL01_00638 [Colletotrichum salicis]